MEYTTNKKYKKPDLLDKVSVQEYNENFDAMDANMAELEEKTNTAVKNASDALKQIEAAGGKVMTSDTLGVGKVDGKTVGVTGDGTLSVIAKAKDIPAEDTSSILGDSSSPTMQALIDAIANKVVNELVTNTALTSTLANYMTKSLMSSQNADNTDMVPTLALTNAMQKSIDTLNSNTSFEFTASNEVSIINNKSVKVGRVVYVAVKIKIESKLTTDSILNFADIAKNQSTTFLIGKGSEWNIDSVVYGYISGNSILINNSQETISVGDFLHINTVLIL